MAAVPTHASDFVRVLPDERRARCVVLGLGNILLRDEGVGVRVVQRMQETRRSFAVEFVDGATAGMDLLDVIADRERVIVVDAVDGEFPAGTVVRLTPADLEVAASAGASLHELGFLDALTAARRLGCAPQDVVIIGIKPHSIRPGVELSDEMEALVPTVAALVERELGLPGRT